MGDMVGAIAFLIGLVLAILLGLFGSLFQGMSGILLMILVIIGIIVGLLNITTGEATPFLMSGVSLILASYFGGQVMDKVPYLGSVLQALLVLFVPATIVVAIKNVFSLAHD